MNSTTLKLGVEPRQGTKMHPPLRPDIEGLRAVAILLVVAYHARIPGFTGGYVGVDVFFVLSGYLITWLLVWEVETKGTLSLVGFYARRARRLLPALAFLLFTTGFVGFVVYSPLEQRGLATTAFSTAAYVSNVYFARAATDYLGAGAETNPLLHTWSLSVEEQFYLVWPLMVMLALGATRWQTPTANRRRLLLWMVAVSLVSFALSVWLTNIRQPFAFFLSPLRGWEFAVGGLGILVPPLKSLPSLLGKSRNPECVQVEPRASVASDVLAWAGILGILVAAVLFDRETPFPGVAALLPVLATVAVLRVSHVRAECRVARILSSKPLQVIGRLSYSWYLWHWPILVLAAAGGGATDLPARLMLLAVSLVFAEGSYRFIEAPIRHNPALTRRPGFSLVMAAVITLTGTCLSLTWRHLSTMASESPAQLRFTKAANDIPTLYAAGCHADFYDVDAVGCTFGPEDSSITIVLFGDSHAAQWFPALQVIAQHRGWRLVSLTKSACPPVGGSRFDQRLGRVYRECYEWQQNVLTRINKIRPSLIVTSGTLYGYNLNELQKGIESMFEALSNSRGAIIPILDSPHPGFDVPTCLARAAWKNPFTSTSSCGFDARSETMQGLYAIQARATSRFTNVFSYDMTDYVCPGGKCLPEMNGIVTYRDSNHLTASFSQSLAPAIAKHLDEVLAHQRSTPDIPGTQ